MCIVEWSLTSEQPIVSPTTTQPSSWLHGKGMQTQVLRLANAVGEWRRREGRGGKEECLCVKSFQFFLCAK